jgi:hypothetical protein
MVVVVAYFFRQMTGMAVVVRLAFYLLIFI